LTILNRPFAILKRLIPSYIPSIVLEAKAIADKLLSNSETAGEGHKLQTLLPYFIDGSYDFDDLEPFLLLTLQDAHPSVYSHPLEGKDDATTSWHVENHKRQTHYTTEEAKNLKLKYPIEREEDVAAIKSISTDTCKCESHQTVTLNAVKELRDQHAALSATGKRDQLNDLVGNLVRRDKKGKLTLKGKIALGGLPLCAKVWQAILKVHNCSV
jgi:hypothetical protein